MSWKRWQKIGGVIGLCGFALIMGWQLGSSQNTLTPDTAFSSVTDTPLPYFTPRLTSPTDGAIYGDVSVMLRWTASPLDAGQQFDVRVWREGESAYGITWTSATQFDLRSWLLDQPPGDFLWKVALIQTNSTTDSWQELAVADTQRFTVTTSTLDILNVPEGFHSEMVAQFPVSAPTAITFDADGSLYVLSITGDIGRLRDVDGDGTFETSEVIFVDENDVLSHAVGMAIRNRDIYVSSSGKIDVLRDTDDDQKPDQITTIIEGLPSLQQTFHSNNGIAFGADDKLYIAVGSTNDHGPVSDPLEASILRANADGSDLEVFATGFRNPYDLVFSPDNALFSADNSPDHLDPTFNSLPPEELNWVREGGFYGYPEVFGTTNRPDVISPIAELPTSSASSGLTYYAADSFPEAYKGIYIALFGTGSSSMERTGRNTGQMVVFVPMERDESGAYATSEWQPFITFDTDLFDYSPIDVTAGPDGALYLAEWTTSTLFRISYEKGL